MTIRSRHALLATVAAATLFAAGASRADDAARDAYLKRAAQGDLSQPGGARRLTGDATAQLQALINDGEVKNVILFIGDGMGDSEITVARNYAEGAGGYFKGIDALPITGQYTHYSLDKATGKPSYVTDSAASGTAWASGVKTYNNAVGVDIREQPHKALIELAKAAGLGTGDITTSEIQDATPAVQVSHVTSRKCYGPSVTSEKCATNALENGGLGSISEQLLDTRPDITMGGGAKTFDETAKAGDWKDKTLLDQAKERGFVVVTNLDEMTAVTAANQDKPVLGLFAPGNMPVRWVGPKATLHGNEQPAVTCQPNPDRPATQPGLAAMTQKAIDVLKANGKGFFLQVEGASIDKQDHAANPCGQIGETVDLDEAVQIGLNFARADGKTLVIVTADHAHSSQIIENEMKAPGLTESLTTKDGSVMTVSYGTDETGESQSHTGAQLRVAAFGPHAANFAGLTDQTDMFYTIRDALKIGEQQRADAQ